MTQGGELKGLWERTFILSQSKGTTPYKDMEEGTYNSIGIKEKLKCLQD